MGSNQHMMLHQWQNKKNSQPHLPYTQQHQNRTHRVQHSKTNSGQFFGTQHNFNQQTNQTPTYQPTGSGQLVPQ